MSPTDSPLQVKVCVTQSHHSDTVSSPTLHQSTAHALPRQFYNEDTETQNARHTLIQDKLFVLTGTMKSKLFSFKAFSTLQF